MDIIFLGGGSEPTEQDGKEDKKILSICFIPVFIFGFLFWVYSIIYEFLFVGNTEGGLALLIVGILIILFLRHV